MCKTRALFWIWLFVRVRWFLRLLKQSEGQSVTAWSQLEWSLLMNCYRLLHAVHREWLGFMNSGEHWTTLGVDLDWYLWLLCSYYRPDLDWKMRWTNVGRRWVCLAGFLRLNLTRVSTRGRHFDNMVIHTTMCNSSSDNEACTSLFTLGVLAITVFTDFIYEDKELTLYSRYLSGF